MRASRLIVAVLALALLGLVPATSSASAAVPNSAVSVPRAATPVAAKARVKKLTAKIVTRKGGKLFITGIIRPKNGPVVIQKATNCNRAKGTCNFKKFRKSKINKKGRYSTRVYAPRNGSWAWRAKKAKTTSEVWLTCIKRPDEDCPIP
jgi:hypothetical protein